MDFVFQCDISFKIFEINLWYLDVFTDFLKFSYVLPMTHSPPFKRSPVLDLQYCHRITTRIFLSVKYSARQTVTASCWTWRNVYLSVYLSGSYLNTWFFGLTTAVVDIMFTFLFFFFVISACACVGFQALICWQRSLKKLVLQSFTATTFPAQFKHF